MGQLSLLDHSDYLETLAKHKDPLEKLDKTIDWTVFLPILNRRLRVKDRKSPAGRPPFDSLMMLKLIVLQSLYGLSDAQTEFQILDRYTFKRFLGIHSESGIPDEKTIWLFKERLGNEGIKRLFRKFNSEMGKNGFSAKKGSIVDASFVDAPKQRNSHDENESIKNGNPPSDWDEPKRRQKDTDARWAKKNNETHYGYKNHVCVDVRRRIIRHYSVTPANVHDSQAFGDMVGAFKENSNKSVFADSAYRSCENEALLSDENLRSQIHEKGSRTGKLTEKQIKRNSKKSSTRVIVEHVFGRMKQLKSDTVRCIGIARATFQIGLANLVYNMDRVASLGGLRPRAG
ncbi:MAG TPA: IS5 family transposase [Fibrobacteraceae bacterium]|nr:IS5 family transposase [Fibrobacteraceae bacterium]